MNLDFIKKKIIVSCVVDKYKYHILAISQFTSKTTKKKKIHRREGMDDKKKWYMKLLTTNAS